MSLTFALWCITHSSNQEFTLSLISPLSEYNTSMSNIQTLPIHATFSPILALAKRDADSFVNAVVALDEDSFWEFVTFAEDVAEWKHQTDFPVRPSCIEIRSGRKNRQFTEWSVQYIPLPFSSGENYCRNLGINIQEAYAKARASAGVHMHVYIQVEELSPYAKKGFIDFGKHKGAHIDDLEESYLLWLFSQRFESWTERYQTFFSVLAEKVRPIFDRMPSYRPEDTGEKITAALTITGVFKTGNGFFATDSEGRKIMLKRQTPVGVEKGQVVECEFHIKDKCEFQNGEKVTIINKWKVK